MLVLGLLEGDGFAVDAVAAADKHYSLGLRKDEEAAWKLTAV